MTRFIKRNGQSIIEYVLVITCIVSALLAVQFYVTRALQGRLRTASDQMGEQYEPGSMTGTLTIKTSRQDNSVIDVHRVDEGDSFDGSIRTEEFGEYTERQGEETMGPFGTSLWE